MTHGAEHWRAYDRSGTQSRAPLGPLHSFLVVQPSRIIRSGDFKSLTFLVARDSGRGANSGKSTIMGNGPLMTQVLALMPETISAEQRLIGAAKW